MTDVDDDILRKARELGVYDPDLADEEMAAFSADMDALACSRRPASLSRRSTPSLTSSR